ncbi:hypothetical protein [Flavobacterium terrigena]|uniref:Uncharacterized protein n=1 Tax=Flavobacterium terrigena TaxID=402734 RepID=A0A1H6ULG9_9FLAO|nr:hypothetical protein [Flavobacterium terrigena]SEI93138.1 hypothetical protein SAMN05660918_1957 [Flavobacterium terrigena]
MLSDKKCKQILNQNGFFYTDVEVILIKETLYKLIEIIHKDDLQNKFKSEKNVSVNDIQQRNESTIMCSTFPFLPNPKPIYKLV